MRPKPSYEDALRFIYDVQVLQHIDLGGPWAGWKIRDQYLVAPDKERIPVRELVGLLIHYRGRFGHHRSKPVAEDVTGNVVSFSGAAVAQLQKRQRVA